MNFVKLLEVPSNRVVYISIDKIVYFTQGQRNDTYIRLAVTDTGAGSKSTNYLFVKETPEDIDKLLMIDRMTDKTKAPVLMTADEYKKMVKLS